MPFKIRDLLINVDTAADVANAEKMGEYCRVPSYCVYGSWCWHFSCWEATICKMGSCPMGTAFEPREGALGNEDLAALKQRLEAALEVVKARQAATNATAVREPETLEEIEALERKLAEALAELKARKARLGGGP